MRPEDELLLRCIRNVMGVSRVSEIKTLIDKGINWNYLLKTANQHGVMPQLYRAMHDTCSDTVPTATLDQLRHHFHINIRNNLLLTAELLKLLELFKSHEIPAFSFKGPLLAAYLYGDFAFRQYGDLDIMVHKQDVPRAQELLMSQGYQPEVCLTSAQLILFTLSEYRLPFLSEGGRCMVEIHWEIAPRYFSFPADPRHLWARLETMSLNGSDLLTLSSEDLMLILCMHGTRHFWERLVWLCDIATLINTHNEMDWGWIREQSRRLGGERMLNLGLFLTNDLLETSLPEKVIQKVHEDKALKVLAKQVSIWLFHEKESSYAFLIKHLLHLKVREQLRDKIRYCLHQAVTPSIGDWSFVKLPVFLYPLYYLLRPIRLLGKYGLSLLKHSVIS